MAVQLALDEVTGRDTVSDSFIIFILTKPVREGLICLIRGPAALCICCVSPLAFIFWSGLS